MKQDVPEWRADMDGWKALALVFDAVGADRPEHGSAFKMVDLYPIMDWVMANKDKK